MCYNEEGCSFKQDNFFCAQDFCEGFEMRFNEFGVWN